MFETIKDYIEDWRKDSLFLVSDNQDERPKRIMLGAVKGPKSLLRLAAALKCYCGAECKTPWTSRPEINNRAQVKLQCILCGKFTCGDPNCEHARREVRHEKRDPSENLQEAGVEAQWLHQALDSGSIAGVYYTGPRGSACPAQAPAG